MPISQKQYPVRFTPRGLSDAFDSTDAFVGACQSLQNLVFDQSNPEIVISRPGASQIANFSGFTTPGVISVHETVGGFTYGMIATGRNAGKDEPFVYNHTTGLFVNVSGVTAGNSPTSPNTSTVAPWTPPTVASVGALILITHPGFTGTGTNFFGVLDITNPATPAWSSQNTGTNVLPSVPLAVANFNNRAYFVCGNQTFFTDVLSLVRTNATNALTIGDASMITALCGLPVQTTSSGVVAALMVFKADQIWQITGDLVGGTLALNFISLTIGCSAPRSIANSPLGTYFVSNSGPMLISQVVGLLPVIYSGQQLAADIIAPFQNAQVPSRISGSYAGNVYRVCVNTIIKGVQSINDYWFDEKKRRWTGPHTFEHDCASQFSDYFILVSNANPAQLIKSQCYPDTSSVYTDLGVSTMGTMQSASLPKTDNMSEKQVVESTIELSSAGSSALYNITAQNSVGDTLNSVFISTPAAGKLWGSNFWGDGSKWTSSINVVKVYTIPWTMPLVFSKLQLQVQVSAGASISIGTAFFRYQDLGYTNSGG